VETTIEVVEQSQVAEVRRLSAELGRAQGLGERDLGRVALIATEASTNLVKYATHGCMTVSTVAQTGAAGVQFISVDRGPGWVDFHAAARDGHSTGGSLGLGLGVILRASDLFDVYTVPGQGSVLLSRVLKDRLSPAPEAGRLELGVRQAPKRGEFECGDAWASVRAGRWQRLCVVDGLGHGPLAASAAKDAVAVFKNARESDSPVDIINRCHAALRSTRGAVMAIAAIDVQGGLLSFAGVGNIGAVVCAADGGTSHLLSTEGIVGYQMRTIRGMQRPWSRGDTLIMSSDGLSGRWNLLRYPELLARHPAVTASVLFRDFARDSDDATVLVAREST
jgi:anti-sigma regulatory factor (Ser/Thr protein kinase)